MKLKMIVLLFIVVDVFLLALVPVRAAVMNLVCPGKGIITFVDYRESFNPSMYTAICKERGVTLRFGLAGGTTTVDSGYVCLHHIAFNDYCFFPDDCFPFVNGQSEFKIDLNEYINDYSLCGFSGRSGTSS